MQALSAKRGMEQQPQESHSSPPLWPLPWSPQAKLPRAGVPTCCAAATSRAGYAFPVPAHIAKPMHWWSPFDEGWRSVQETSIWRSLKAPSSQTSWSHAPTGTTEQSNDLRPKPTVSATSLAGAPGAPCWRWRELSWVVHLYPRCETVDPLHPQAQSNLQGFLSAPIRHQRVGEKESASSELRGSVKVPAAPSSLPTPSPHDKHPKVHHPTALLPPLHGEKHVGSGHIPLDTGP